MSIATIILFLVGMVFFVAILGFCLYLVIRDKIEKKLFPMFLKSHGFYYEEPVQNYETLPFKSGDNKDDCYFVFVINKVFKSF